MKCRSWYEPVSPAWKKKRRRSIEAGNVCPVCEGSEQGVSGATARVEQSERRPRMVTDVREPTLQARIRHELTHVPYRPWCKFCVAGRGRSRYHRELEHDLEAEVPVVAMDYGYLGPKGKCSKSEQEAMDPKSTETA